MVLSAVAVQPQVASSHKVRCSNTDEVNYVDMGDQLLGFITTTSVVTKGGRVMDPK